MTEPEQRAWVDALGSTPARRMAVIEYLLRFASHDEMSVADRAICRAQLLRLHAERTAWRRTTTRRR